ncbi:MAG: hypothetical protein KJ838_00415 [Candidatus Omnitrophica bacterium]|nr:hypothetical protein [Candidatus Omnitrophota bacterium]
MENLQSLNPNRSQKALKVLKTIIIVFLLPWVYSFSLAFVNESQAVQRALFNSFVCGIISFLVIYLFIYSPSKVYQKGQKMTEATFRFISPLVKVAPFVMPIYSIIIFLLYALIFRFVHSQMIFKIFMFLIGFSIILHLVFSAKVLHSRKDDFLMINYLFSFIFIYLINVALLSLGFSIIFKAFSLNSFCQSSLEISSSIFSAVFNQLFTCPV